MPYVYSDVAREADPRSLPDVWVTQLTAQEVAEGMDEAQWERRKRFPLASMNNRDRDALIESIIEEENVVGGWVWCFCQVGCLPDSDFSIPFPTYDDAVADMREHVALLNQ